MIPHRPKKLFIAAALVLVCMLPTAAWPAPADLVAVKSLPLKSVFGTKDDWNVTAYEAAGEEARTGDVPARICFWKLPRDTGGDCTSLTRSITNTDLRQVFQTIEDLSVVRLVAEPHAKGAVLVRAIMKYGGSGSLRQFSLWAYDRSEGAFAPIATMSVTEQGEVRIFDTDPLAGHIVTADALLLPGETHFGRHHYTITVRSLNAASGSYEDILHYVTADKYPGLDQTNRVTVVQHEIPTIQFLLKSVYPAKRGSR